MRLVARRVLVAVIRVLPAPPIDLNEMVARLNADLDTEWERSGLAERGEEIATVAWRAVA